MTAKLRLFLSSYVPLFVVSAIRFDDLALRLTLGFAAVVGALSLFSLIRVSGKKIQSIEVMPTSSRDIGSEVAAYLSTYILPFVTVSQPTTRDLIAYSIVFVTIGVVFVNSDLLGVNPLLYLLGFHVFRVSGTRMLKGGEYVDAVIISRGCVSSNSRISIVSLAEGVHLVVPSRTKDTS